MAKLKKEMRIFLKISINVILHLITIILSNFLTPQLYLKPHQSSPSHYLYIHHHYIFSLHHLYIIIIFSLHHLYIITIFTFTLPRYTSSLYSHHVVVVMSNIESSLNSLFHLPHHFDTFSFTVHFYLSSPTFSFPFHIFIFSLTSLLLLLT